MSDWLREARPRALPRVPAGGPGGWQIGRGEMADAFVVCWQFCLRFGSEVVGLNAPGHSDISLHVDEGKHQVQVQFRRRKGKVAPDPASRARARRELPLGSCCARSGGYAYASSRANGCARFASLGVCFGWASSSCRASITWTGWLASSSPLPTSGSIAPWSGGRIALGAAGPTRQGPLLLVRGPRAVRTSRAQALRTGGPAALFFEGGWRSVAAFGRPIR